MAASKYAAITSRTTSIGCFRIGATPTNRACRGCKQSRWSKPKWNVTAKSQSTGASPSLQPAARLIASPEVAANLVAKDGYFTDAEDLGPAKVDSVVVAPRESP
jgi:hypothetical protein